MARPPRRDIREDPGRVQLCTSLCILAPEILDIVCVRGRLPRSIMSQGRSPHFDVNQTSAVGFPPLLSSPFCHPSSYFFSLLFVRHPSCNCTFSSSLIFLLFQFQSLQSTPTAHYNGSLHLVAKPDFSPVVLQRKA